MSQPHDKTLSARRTLLIGSDALVGAWSAHASRADHVVAVAHTDLARALAHIDQAQPEVVIVEQSLAGTHQGMLLMEHLHNERTLRGLEISLLPPDAVEALLSKAPGRESPHAWLTRLSQPLPSRPVRGAVRVPVEGQEQVSIDGQTAHLLDVSATGAQVESSGSLRPNQHVRLALSKARGSATTEGVVVWSSLQAGPPMHYRAGIVFKTAVPQVVQGTEVTVPPEAPSTKPRRASTRAPRKPRRKTPAVD